MSSGDLQASQCDFYNTIRPSYSSLTRAPSWSLGVGADGCKELEAVDSRLRNVSDESTANSQQQNDPSTNLSQSNSTNGSLNERQYPKLELSVPTVYLTRKSPSTSTYHVYQLTVRTQSGAEWSVYRRYSQFHALHQQLKATKDPTVMKLQFPPKHRINSKASTIVQDRRRKLEEYMRALNWYIGKLPSSESDVSRTSQQLQDLLLLRSNDSTSSPSLQSSPSSTNHSTLFEGRQQQPNTQNQNPPNDDNASTAICVEQLNQEDETASKLSEENEDSQTAPSSGRTSQTGCDQNSRNAGSDLSTEVLCPHKEKTKDIKTLFYDFILIKDKKDEEFDPSNENFGATT